jgi:hypothetical protein
MKRLAKALAYALALAVALAGLTVVTYISLSDAQHRWLATRIVSALLDSPVEFRGSFSVDLGRRATLTAGDLWIGVGSEGQSLGTPVEGRLGAIELEMDLGALLRGTVLIHRLVVDSVDVTLVASKRDEDPRGSWREWVHALEKAPVLFFETAQLSEIRVMRPAGPDTPTMFVELHEVNLTETGGSDGGILLDGDITINGHPLALWGEFGSLAAARDPSLPYPARLMVLHPALEATLEGRVGDPLGARGIDLRARLEVPDLRALEDMMPRWPWPEGRLSAVGALTGDIERLSLHDLTVAYDDAAGRTFEISGYVANALELRGAALALSARLPQAHVVLNPLLERELPALAEVSLTGHLSNDGRSWRAKDLDVEIMAEAGWSLSGSGAVGLVAEGGGVVLDRLALDLALAAQDTGAFSALTGKDIATLGPVMAAGALSGDETGLELTGLSFRVGKEGGILVTGDGRVDLTDLDAAVDGGLVDGLGLDLVAKLEAPAEEVARMLLHMDWPDPGPLSTAVRITGQGRELRLAPRAFSFDGASGTRLRLGPTDERSGLTLLLGEEPDISDLRVPLLAAAPGTTALRPWLGSRPLPDLKDITGRAILVGGGEDLGLHDIVLTVGRESQPRIKASGRLDTKGQERIDLTADFWADLAEIVNPFLTVPLKPLGGVKGRVELSNADGSLGIERLEVTSLKDGDAWLKLSGAIDDIARFAEADLSFEVGLTRLELIRRAFEPDWDGEAKSAFWQRAASLDGRFLAHQPARFASLQGQGGLGDAGLLVDLRLSGLNDRPDVRGAVSLTHVNLGDFGVGLTDDDGDDAARSESEWLFSDAPLELTGLEGVSLDLKVAVDDIVDPLVKMRRIDARLVWNDTTFALKPAAFVYEGGHVDLDLSVDFQQDPPAYGVTMVGDDMNLGRFLSRFDVEKPLVEGNLTIDTQLEARGSSARELAASVSGDLTFALENGRLNHGNLELLAPETFQWFLAASKGKSHSDLNCVVGHFDLADGVAESDSLFLSAPKVRLSGTGRVDFAREELDIVLAADRPALAPPGLSKPVRFHGRLAAPEVETSATGHAADVGVAAAGVVLMPMVFGPWYAASFLFSQLDEAGEDSPCLLDREAAEHKRAGLDPAGRWTGSDSDWTLTLTFEETKATGKITRQKGQTPVTGTVKGEIRSDGIFVGWTTGRTVGNRKIYGRMPQLVMWGGRNDDGARFAMRKPDPQSEE